MVDQISWIIFSIPSLLIASTVHEFAHAWTAYKLGDLTAKLRGRLTLNPLAHIDLVGGLMMILTRFGWSKPVPINEQNFKNPIIGTAITSAAGSISNITMAFMASMAFRIMNGPEILVQENMDLKYLIAYFLLVFISLNLSLGIFNLIPLPPLDGHKIVRAFLPKNLRYYWESFEKYGTWVLILIFIPFSPLNYVVNFILSTAISILAGIFLG
ncbi:site-2 protease family protein [Candidatus Dojkabacteria bacterium]|nr:site-2 protease family protein [Candidatus Dojkabacteria bacterium]